VECAKVVEAVDDITSPGDLRSSKCEKIDMDLDDILNLRNIGKEEASQDGEYEIK